VSLYLLSGVRFPLDDLPGLSMEQSQLASLELHHRPHGQSTTTVFRQYPIWLKTVYFSGRGLRYQYVCAYVFVGTASSFAPECPRNRPGEPCAASATGGDEATASAASPASSRAHRLGLVINCLEPLAAGPDDCPSRDRSELASQGVPPLLDLDFQAQAQRSTRGEHRDQSPDSPDGGIQSGGELRQAGCANVPGLFSVTC